MNRALIIRKPWIDLILEGKKVWEMRSKPTKVRGRIGLIEAGTGLIVGEAHIVDCFHRPLQDNELRGTMSYHQVENIELLKKWRFPWQLEKAKRYETPIPYDHPKGAVIWVDLNKLTPRPCLPL